MEHLFQFRVREACGLTADRGRTFDAGVIQRIAKRVATDHSSRTDDDQPLLGLSRGHDSGVRPH